MKLLFLTRFISAAALTASLMTLQAQDDAPLSPDQLRLIPVQPAVSRLAKAPLRGGIGGSSAALKLAVWPYQFVSTRDGNTYAGTIVGGNPLNHGARTTTVPVVIIPLRIQFTGTVRNFDPTSPDVGCLGAGNTAITLSQASPIFQPAPYTINGVNVGTTTFPDAFQRAQFWPSVSQFAPAYHLAFNVSVAAKQTISVVNNGATGATFNFSGNCTTNTLVNDNPPRLGVIDINFLDPLLTGIITTLGITPNQFPLFIIYGVVISDGTASNLNNCCILGYHNADGTALAPGQTYGIAGYDQGYLFSGTKDISVLSHEVMEWVDDPSGSNPTPPWGNIGQVSGCQGNLENGDPLSGTLMPPVTMPNGVTYHAQELAFFSWYYGVPYPGAGGVYSSNGTFAGVAKLCPPGGTN